MSNISDYFKRLSVDLELLSDDIPRLIKSVEKSQKMDEKQKMEPRKFEGLPPRSLEPISKLRKNKEEIKEANANKEVFFVKDRIKNIFMGK